MPTVRTVALAAAAVAGLTGLALAANFHEMTVSIPGGGIAHIRYTGDVPPKVNFVQADPSAVGFPVGIWSAPSPFAEMDRISEMMNRQMTAMRYQARLIHEAAFAPVDQAMLKDMPAGAARYSFVSTMSGGDFCARTTEITAAANGGAPKVVTHTSGNCGAAPKTTPNQVRSTPQPQNAVPLQTITYTINRPAAPARQGI